MWSIGVGPTTCTTLKHFRHWRRVAIFAARSRITMRFRPIEALNKMGVNRSWLDSCAKHEKKASFMLKLLYMKRK